MDETATELRALRQSLGFMKALLFVQCMFFIGMTWGIYTASNSAGPRLLRLREENESLRKENAELRADLRRQAGKTL